MKTNRNSNCFANWKNLSAKEIRADSIGKNKREISKTLKSVIIITGLILINIYIVFAVHLITKM